MYQLRWKPVALLITLGIVCVLLPGCMGFNYSPSRDIVILKLNVDGAQEWTRTIDGGQDDAGDDVVEVRGGDLVLVGRNGTSRRVTEHPRVIRLSSDGKVIADQTNADRFDQPRAVIADPDGGFAVLTQTGQVTRFNRVGDAVWTRSTNMSEAYSLTGLRDGSYLVSGSVRYLIRSTNNSPVMEEMTVRAPVVTTGRSDGSSDSTKDAGSLGTGITTTPGPTEAGSIASEAIPISSYTSTSVTKAEVVKFTSDGEIAWQRTYDEGIPTAHSVLEDPGDGSLLIAGYSPDPVTSANRTPELVILRTDRDGTAGPLIRLGLVDSSDPVQIRASPEGIEVIYSTVSPRADGRYHYGVALQTLDPAGRVIGRRSLNASRVINGTSDGGYISVGVPASEGDSGYESMLSAGPHTYTTFHALRFDVEGHLLWDRALSIGTIREVKRVIQTSDGGYVILAMSERG